jgi:hypothetical protein
VVAGLGEDGQAEVGELRLTEPGDQQVGRLDVAVKHAERVRVGERVGDLDTDVAGLDRRERVVPHALGVRPLAQLHDQIRVTVRRHARVEEIDHVRVAGHPTRGARLAQEPPLVPLALQAPVFDLDRDVPPHRFLDSPVHGGVSTPGKHRQAG